MKKNLIYSLIAAVILTVVLLTGCSSGGNDPQDPVAGEGNEPLSFKPAECGILAEEQLVYPYSGMTLTLKQELLDKMNSYDVAAWTDEDNNSEGLLDWATLSWYAQTEEQKKEEVTGFNPEEWLNSLSKIGVIGVYSSSAVAELDELTGCTNHTQLGKSADGAYTYYLSIADGADRDLAKLLSQTTVTVTEMTPLDLNMGKRAFSEARIDAKNVGTFTTTDIYGKKQTNKLFAESELTLVNVFATWCTPCVQEIPELDKLKKNMEDKGVNVVTVVLDSTNGKKVNEEIVELAKRLSEKQKLSLTMLVPDETKMNGRLQGIDSVPESFFVDKDGNIVGETYVGAKNLEQWTKIVEKELEAIK